MPHARAHEDRTHQFQAQEGAETEETVGEVAVRRVDAEQPDGPLASRVHVIGRP